MNKYSTGILTCTLLFVLAFTLSAQAQTNDVSSTLELYKITINPNGEEVAEQVTTTAPGDTIEYRLTYTNNLSETVSNLNAVLPVPQGIRYIDTAEPVINAASLQASGDTFQQIPIQRNVTLENGQTEQQEIPATEYRRLRWTIPTLEPQESVTLSAQMRVIDNTAQQQ